MKVIQKELGRDDIAEVDELREQVKNAEMSEEAEEKALKELDRLAQIHRRSPPNLVLSAPMSTGYWHCRGKSKRSINSSSLKPSEYLMRIITD